MLPENPPTPAFTTFLFGDVESTDCQAPREVSLAVHVPASLRWLDGHFPGDPIVPGIAQLLPLVAGAASRVLSGLGPPVGCSRVKFLRRIEPGESLRVTLHWTPDSEPGQGKLRFAITGDDDVARTTGYLRFDPRAPWTT